MTDPSHYLNRDCLSCTHPTCQQRGTSSDAYSACWDRRCETAVSRQCETCKHTETRACIYHGYPESTRPSSCEYKLGTSAELAMRNLTGTFIDCRTKEHDAAIMRNVLARVAHAIEHQKDHKEFLLSRSSKDVVLDILDSVGAGI